LLTCSYLSLYVQNSEELTAAIKYGEEQFTVLKRQVIVGNLYPSDTSVMDFKVAR
jgi:hypothetical protein